MLLGQRSGRQFRKVAFSRRSECLTPPTPTARASPSNKPNVDPSPAQLPPKEIFQQLAAVLWAVVYESVMKTISYDGFHSRLGCDWTEIMYDYHVYHEYWPRMPITMLHNT